MSTKEAIANRILQLCDERHIAVNELASISGISPSTVYSILNEKSQNPGTITIKKLCDGLEITLTVQSGFCGQGAHTNLNKRGIINENYRQ